MGKLAVSNFKGRIPRISEKLLPNNNAQSYCLNVDLRRGKLQAIYEATETGEVQKSSPVFIFKCGSKWDCYTAIVSIVRSWIYDSNARFYVTDGSQPEQTKLDLINDCLESGSATTFYYLGVTAPTTAPSLTPVYDGGTPGDEIQATLAYVFTYVTSWGEESAPSPASEVTEIMDDGYMTVSCPTPTGERPAASLITKIRIYRLNSGTAGAEYQYLTEKNISAATTSHDDRDGEDYSITPAADLGEAIETEGWDHPPSALDGIVSWANGLMAGFVANLVYINEPYIPYAYPSEYRKDLESNVVAMGYIPGSNALVVTTETHPYLMVGTDPYSIVPLKLENVGKNVSKRSTVSTPLGVLYASPTGLILVNMSGAKNVTDKIYKPSQWDDLTPANLIGAYYDGKYYGFYLNTDHCVIIDFQGEPQVSDVYLNEYPEGYDLYVKDVFVDPATDTLYILALSEDTKYYILEYEGSSTDKLSYTFRSKTWSGNLTNYSCGRIKGTFGESDTVTFQLVADGSARKSKSVSSEEIFRLPAGYVARDWYFQLDGDIDIDEAAIAEDPEDFADVL